MTRMLEESPDRDSPESQVFREQTSSRHWPQYLAATAATMGAFAGGTVLAWTSPAVPLLQREDSPFNLTSAEASWVGSIMPLGAVFGAPPAGILTQAVGRKVAVLSLSAPFLLSWLLVLTTNSAAWLCAARWLAGVGLGGVCVACPIYVAEVAEDSIRGACGALLQVMFNVGILFSYGVGAAESYTALAWGCAAIPALFLAFFAWMPETPASLVSRGLDNEAARSLRWLRGPRARIDGELDELRRGREKAAIMRAETSFISAICEDAARKGMIVSMGLVAAQQLSGVCVVFFYTESIFKAAGSSLTPAAASVVVGLVMLAMSYVTTVVVDRVGRRALLILSAGTMGLSLATLALYFQLKSAGTDVTSAGLVPLLAVNTFIIAYCLGLGPLPWTVMAEVLPPDIKGPAGSLVSAFCWILSFAVTKSFQGLVDALGTHSAFWLFACFSTLTVAFVIFVVPETRGKSLQQIQAELSGRPQVTSTN